VFSTPLAAAPAAVEEGEKGVESAGGGARFCPDAPITSLGTHQTEEEVEDEP
jgi:hypothetical protein